MSGTLSVGEKAYALYNYEPYEVKITGNRGSSSYGWPAMNIYELFCHVVLTNIEILRNSNSNYIIAHMTNLQQSNGKFKYDSNFNDVKIFPDKKNILIIGAGGHAKMIIDIINADKTYNIVGIVDASSMIKSNSTIINDVMGIPVICDDSH